MNGQLLKALLGEGCLPAPPPPFMRGKHQEAMGRSPEGRVYVCRSHLE